MGTVQYAEVHNNHDTTFALGRCPICALASYINLRVVAGGGGGGAQGISFEMSSYFGGQAIRVHEQPAKLAEVHVSWLRGKHVTNVRLAQERSALVDETHTYACMYVCAHVCMKDCMYVCMYVCMHVRTHVHTYTHVYIYMCVYIYIYLYRHVCARVGACAYVCVYIYIYIYIYIYMCLYIHCVK